MIAENPRALSYILPADVFFLPADKLALTENAPISVPEAIDTTVAEPAISYQATEPMVVAPTIPKIVVTEPVAPVLAVPKIEISSITPPTAPDVKPAATATPANTPNFTFLGGFDKKFLVIVSYPRQDVMEPAHLKALESTIVRKGMTLNDVAIFNIGKYPGTDLKAIARAFKPKRMLLLGRDSFPIGLAEQPLNQLTLLGTCQLLYSDSFTDMMGNKEKTKAFWSQMQSL